MEKLKFAVNKNNSINASTETFAKLFYEEYCHTFASLYKLDPFKLKLI